MNYTDIDYVISYCLLGLCMGLFGFLVGLYSKFIEHAFYLVHKLVKKYLKNGTAGKKE